MLRSLSLGILWDTIRECTKETSKQAIRTNRAIALLTLFIHLVPTGAAIALAILNFRELYIGGELAGPSGNYDNIKLSGLQFAAKLHELLMQASLSVVILATVRHGLVSEGHGVPFGAIFGSLQFTNPAYLWSKEFSGALRAEFRHKRCILAAIVLVTILASSVGPSSAIAMRPRMEDWPAGGTYIYLNATREQIWPSSFDGSDIPPACRNVSVTTDCISSGWNTIADNLLPFWRDVNGTTNLPETFQFNSPKALRVIKHRYRAGIYGQRWTLATTPMSNLADSVSEIGRLWARAAYWSADVAGKHSRRFKYRKDVTYAISNVYQPLTSATCTSNRGTNFRLDEVKIPVISAECEDPKAKEAKVPTNHSEVNSIISKFNQDKSTSPVLRFVELPAAEFGVNTIGAIITFPESWSGQKNLVTCAIDARWAPVTTLSRRTRIMTVEGEPANWISHGTCNKALEKKVTVRPKWAEYLNPFLEVTDRSLFHTLVNVVGPSKKWGDDKGFVEPLIETILVNMITNGLSRTAFSATPQGSLKGCDNTSCYEACGAWCTEIIPKAEFSYGGDIYNHPTNTDKDNKAKMSQFRVKVDIKGYAFSYRSITVTMSCVLLLLYCFVVVVHIGFTIWSGRTSYAWDTHSEVAALAMQSRPTSILKNISAGIATSTTFSRIVRVVETGTDGKHLELDFAKSNYSDANPPKPDKFYD